MPGVNIPHGSFSNWPLFERELRDALGAMLDEQAVDRVMSRVQRAYAALQLPGLLGSIDLEHAAQVVRYEAWSKEFQAAQEKMLAVLIESFVALEARPPWRR